MKDVKAALNFGLKKLGFKEIKQNQRKVVESYLSGRDVLMVAPTGSGKSLTFQISPFVIEYWNNGDRCSSSSSTSESGTTCTGIETVCLVIAPLVSLMKDQVAYLRGKGIQAVIVGPESSEDENRDARDGKYNLVFASPEALFNSHRSTIRALKNKIEAVFIDEGHCVVKWGHGSGAEDAFRKEYSRLAELRSILKRSTPFIVLTATATEAVRNTIIKDLSMEDCVQLVTVPNKPNIRFSISAVDPDDLYTSFKWLIDELDTKQLQAQKVLIFCRKRAHVKELYETFHEALGPKSYVLPSGKEPFDDRTRLFAMYHKNTHHLVKEVVEREFCKLNGSVRVVFCTIAFGMGVNVQGAYLALHLGPSSCLDDYIQEVGRIGRNSDMMSHAVLLKYSGCTRSKNISKEMKGYVKNTDVCRRSLLMQPFLTKEEQTSQSQPHIEPYSCCNVCTETCRCMCSCQDVCLCKVVCNSESFYSPMESYMHASITKGNIKSISKDASSITDKNMQFQKETSQLVRDELLKYRAKLAHDIPDKKLLTGIDIATGFSSSLIEYIVRNIGKIDSLSTLKNMFNFFNEEHAVKSWQIISNVKENVLPIESHSNDSDEFSFNCLPSTSCEHTSADESDESDIYVRHRISHILHDSDSDDTD